MKEKDVTEPKKSSIWRLLIYSRFFLSPSIVYTKKSKKKNIIDIHIQMYNMYN